MRFRPFLQMSTHDHRWFLSTCHAHGATTAGRPWLEGRIALHMCSRPFLDINFPTRYWRQSHALTRLTFCSLFLSFKDYGLFISPHAQFCIDKAVTTMALFVAEANFFSIIRDNAPVPNEKTFRARFHPLRRPQGSTRDAKESLILSVDTNKLHTLSYEQTDQTI